jgi:hypothetical protein
VSTPTRNASGLFRRLVEERLSVYLTVQEQDTTVEALVAGTLPPLPSKQALVDRIRFTYATIDLLRERLHRFLR